MVFSNLNGCIPLLELPISDKETTELPPKLNILQNTAVCAPSGKRFKSLHYSLNYYELYKCSYSKVLQ